MAEERAGLSDQQWANITDADKGLALPTAARSAVDDEINRFRELKKAWKLAPHIVRENLDRITGVAEKLADLLVNLGYQERIELIEAWPLDPAHVYDGHNSRVDAFILRTRVLVAACKAVQPTELTKPEIVDGLVERIDTILREHLDTGVSGEKKIVFLLGEILAAADHKLAERSIMLAVQRLRERRKV